MDKKAIREKICLARKNLPKEAILKKSKEIIEALTGLKEYADAETVMSYISLDEEVDTKEFIKNELGLGKTLVVPFMENDVIHVSKLKNLELAKGRFGVLEPVKKEICDDKIDLVLVPGIAFDINGSRIGFGNGCYDRFLENCNALKIGLAFEEQIVEPIPAEKHDKQVDMIITDKRVIRCMK